MSWERESLYDAECAAGDKWVYYSCYGYADIFFSKHFSDGILVYKFGGCE
jgi:hypothetical protein